MNCKNCGTFNNPGSKFCIKCGQSLADAQPEIEQSASIENIFPEVSSQPVNNSMPNQNENIFQTNVTSTQTINNSVINVDSNAKISFMSYLFIILAVILKPFTAFKEELNKFNGFKNSAIVSLIVSGIATIVNLITSMLEAVRVKSFDWSSGEYTTTWTWENLKELDYVQVIGKNFLIYLGIIVAIAVIFYIVGLVAKKNVSFSRMLGISALGVAPMLICSLILSPLLSLISTELTMPIILVGAVYTIVLLYEGMNSEVLLEGDAKYYFNLVCFSILGVAAYYLGIELMMSSISGGLEDVMDLFG